MKLPFFGRRGRRDAAIAHFAASRGAPEKVETPPQQPHELIDVLGVGLTHSVGGVALTLLSVERYREGHVALFRLFRARGPFEREFPSPHLDLSITLKEPHRTASG